MEIFEKLNIDTSIFLIFLALNLCVGLYYGRKVKTIDDYALGGRDFSTAVLVSTVIATFTTGSGFFITISKTYTDGISYVFASSFRTIQFLIVAYIFIPRMAKLLGALSIAEVMGNFYGKYVRIITAVTGIIWNVGGIAVQFKVFGTIFTYFLGIDPVISIILAASIITIYSAFGGIRAVTYTDVLQFATFGFCIPVIAFLIWNSLNTSGIDFTVALNKPIFDFFRVFSPSNPGFLDMILLGMYFTIPSIGPIHFQRISMGRNIGQIQKVFVISAIIMMLIGLLEAWIPFLLFSVNPELDSSTLISYIINNYTHIGLKSLMIIGVSALAMSSADSFINGSAVLFGHDVCKVLNIKYDKLILSKIFAVILGIFATYLALSTNDLLAMVMSAASFYIPIVTIPLTATILGFRTTKKPVYIAMFAAFITVILWDHVFKIKTNVIVPTLGINAFFLFASHYLLRQPGGWIGNKDDNHLISFKKQKSYRLAKFIENFKNFNLINFCIKNLPKSDLTYSLVGVFCFISTIATIYASETITIKTHSDIMLWLYQIMLVISSCLMLWVIWSPRIKTPIFVGIFWHFAIIYMFVFTSAFFLFLSDFGKLQLMLFTIHLMLLFILMRWQIGIIMLVIGLGAAFSMYDYYISSFENTIQDTWTMFLYILLLMSSALITILKPIQDRENLMDKKVNHQSEKLHYQEEELQKLLNMKKDFLRNLEHELNTPLTGVTSMGQVLFENYNKLSQAQIHDGLKTIVSSSHRLSSLVNNIVDLSKLLDFKGQLNIKEINLTQLVFERLNICKKVYIEEKEEDAREFVFIVEENIFAHCDEYYISQAIDSILVNAIKYCKKGKITISLTQQDNCLIRFTVCDEGIGIPENEIHDIFGEFTTSSYTKTPAGGRGIGLALCKKIVTIHKGEVGVESNKDKGSTFFFIIPK